QLTFVIVRRQARHRALFDIFQTCLGESSMKYRTIFTYAFAGCGGVRSGVSAARRLPVAPRAPGRRPPAMGRDRAPRENAGTLRSPRRGIPAESVLPRGAPLLLLARGENRA